MLKRTLFRLVPLLVVLAVLAAVPAVATGQEQTLYVGEPRYACWASGSDSDQGNDGPFDERDLDVWGSDPGLMLDRWKEIRGSLIHGGAKNTGCVAYGGEGHAIESEGCLNNSWFYGGLPELADGAFYAPYEQSVKYGVEANGGNYEPWLAGQNASSPWGAFENYVKYVRSTSKTLDDGDGINDIKTTWTGAGVEGGHYVDPLAAAELQRSAQADILATSQEQMIGGNRVITEQRQVPVSNPTGRMTLNCNPGGACTHTYVQDTEIVSISARADSLDTNNAEYLNTTFQPNQRNIGAVDVEGNVNPTFSDILSPGFLDPNLLDPSNPLGGNFPDTTTDAIVVELELSDRYRKDFEHDLGWVVGSVTDDLRSNEKLTMSRFFDGEERLRVLEKYAIGATGATDHMNTKYTMPPYVASNAGLGQPAVRQVDGPVSGSVVISNVDVGWMDYSVEKMPAYVHAVEVSPGLRLGRLLEDNPHAPIHVGYRTSWLTSSREDSALTDRLTPFKDVEYPGTPPDGVVIDKYRGLYDDAEGVIQWPVYFSDVAWYLFDIQPDTSGDQQYAGDFGALTRNNAFMPIVTSSGFGVESVPMYDFSVCTDNVDTSGTGGHGRTDEPTCVVPEADPGDPPDPNAGTELGGLILSPDYGQVWHIEAVNLKAGKGGDGSHPKAVFPFEDKHGMALDPAHPGRRLQSGWLVMQGVERAEDTDQRGLRTHSSFRFEIRDGSWFGAESAFSKGSEGLIQYGMHPDFQDSHAPPMTRAHGRRQAARYARTNGVSDAGVLDPDKGYLLVLTFYQVKEEDGQGWRLMSFGHRQGADIARVPGLQVRRVVCRAWVLAAAEQGSTAKEQSIIDRIKAGISTAAGSMFEALEGMLKSILQMIYRGQFQLVKAASGAVCTGMEVMDAWAVGRDVEHTFSAREHDKKILLDPAVVADKKGIRDCGTLKSDEPRTCDSELGDINFRGRCRSLPKLKLEVTGMRLYDPANFRNPSTNNELRFNEKTVLYDPKLQSYDAHVDREVVFKPIRQGMLYSPRSAGRRVAQWEDKYAAGLTEVEVEWSVENESVEDELRKLVTGYVVELVPDPRSMRYGVEIDQWIPLVMPRYTRYSPCGVSLNYNNYAEISGVRFGALGGEATTESNKTGHACSSFGHSISHGIKLRGIGFHNDVRYQEYTGDDSLIHQPRFITEAMSIMPLAPDWAHTIRVRPYHGVPGTPGFRLGPRSDPLSLDGSYAACLYQDRLLNERGQALTGQDLLDGQQMINQLYGCTTAQSQEARPVEADSLVSRVLSPVGSDLCKDLFTSTPGHLTWDNPVVRQLWTLMWVLSGLVLLALLLWQGVKMSYDMWVDPQPSFGLRELVPRMLLAVVLAAASLWLCQVVLVVASDLTCFVAQATGTTMWGIVSSTVGDVMRIFQNWEHALTLDDSASLADILMAWLKLIVVVFVILVFLILFVIVFIKVCIFMLIRLVTLAALIVFAPLAFTLYASDSTAHWTKLWLKMFLGQTFVQVVVLVILYMGINLMTSALSFGGVGEVSEQEKGLSDLIVGILIAFLTFGLADSVPKIISPQASGLTDSVRGMGRMAVGGAVMGAAAVAGIATGGVSAVAHGGVAATRGAAAGWQGQMPGAGGAQSSGSPASAAAAAPLSAVSAAGPPGSSGAQAPGSAAAGNQQQGEGQGAGGNMVSRNDSVPGGSQDPQGGGGGGESPSSGGGDPDGGAPAGGGGGSQQPGGGGAGGAEGSTEGAGDKGDSAGGADPGGTSPSSPAAGSGDESSGGGGGSGDGPSDAGDGSGDPGASQAGSVPGSDAPDSDGGDGTSSEQPSGDGAPATGRRGLGSRLAGAALGAAAAVPVVGAGVRGMIGARNAVRASDQNTGGFGRRLARASGRGVGAAAGGVGKFVDKLPNGPIQGAQAGMRRGRAVNSMIDRVMSGSLMTQGVTGADERRKEAIERQKSEAKRKARAAAESVGHPPVEPESPVEVSNEPAEESRPQASPQPQAPPQPAQNAPSGYQVRNSGLIVPAP